jgi:hypothetical protein
MINAYFSNIQTFEEESQSLIKSLRFKLYQSSNSSEELVYENYKTQLENKERELFYNVGLRMNEIRKGSISGLIYILNPFLTIYNERFTNYLVESEIEDKNLLSFLERF